MTPPQRREPSELTGLKKSVQRIEKAAIELSALTRGGHRITGRRTPRMRDGSPPEELTPEQRKKRTDKAKAARKARRKNRRKR
ncbi:hypothetical protein [Actinomadura rudentiformis]|uniref:Uncharacterized protein n=1 Tax=Actinomadura rudentiformis TaxID=359158 RepID=A0A6H9YI65_9ACTN|nr:hypothetical protein [Actinomadura rudentiformis]KAB2344897.1 hypothetical protein F8566_30370 [Actinomadura rudentiformis]